MKINPINTIKEKYLYIFVFIFSLISIYSIISLNYNSTQGADYAKYSNYLDYFLSNQEKTNLEQGLIYFYIIAFFINLFTARLNAENAEYIFSLGIQVGNFYIFIIGLIGLYLLLKLFNYHEKYIFLCLSLVCFFPQTISLLVTFKPEILAFSLLVWSIYFIEKYFKTESNIFLYISIFPLVLLMTTKGSVTGMVGIFILLKYRTKLKDIDFKTLIYVVLLFLVFFSIILYENYQENGLFILDPPHDETIYNQKADIYVVYNINFKELLSKPYQHEHRDSLLGIYLLDTFDDYFQLYWNFDKSLFDQYRKDIFITNDSNNLISIDFSNRNIAYNGPGNFYLMFLRQYIAIGLGLIFYYLMFSASRKKKYSKLFILSPLIGVLISVINSVFGFPQKNFDPSRADVFKTFYFSFFIILSFAFVVMYLINNKSKLKAFLIPLYIISIIFILGFPKANNDEFDYKISENNKYSLTCNLNTPFLKATLFETSNVDCPKVENIICSEEYFKKESNNLELQNRNSKKVIVNSYESCINFVSKNYTFVNNLELNKIPKFNLAIYLLFKLLIFYTIFKYEKK